MDLSQVPTLETERLWMRLFRENDIDDYAAMNADPEVTQFIGGPWDRSRSWRHLAFLIGHWKLRGAGMWALEHKGTGAFVGMVGFSEPEGWPGFDGRRACAAVVGARLRVRGSAGRHGIRFHRLEG